MRQVTVTEHLLLHQTKTPDASGKFTALFYDLILAAKTISKTMNKAGLLDILGATGEINVQGEQVQKLDAYANRVLIHRMERTGVLCAIASEENADFLRIPAQYKQGEYILIFDPLDGSSNVDVNVNVGTIFSILRRKSPSNNDVTLGDILQSGVEQVAAGYFLYGPSTMLVYSTGDGVHGFTLDPSVGEFLLSHPDLRIPEQGKVYSVNEGYYQYWDDATREVIEHFKGDANPLGKPYSARYIGSLVADFHRGLLNGGIYMYPVDNRNPGKAKGKLRYLCEASPLAYIAEQAGGAATNGTKRILELQPDELHERVPLFIGSKNDVEAVAEIYNKRRSTAE
ncbi:class 1 fructose-bisphosphatase [Halodesulfovibrio sp.]|jgi:fructose-1,6-bisphosphatase I|uniref:class 1 fructose-bisphosphatase n=1 Tax=Halodesulfovibrio sp. TaxID=1912772 RepID=UPI0025CD41FE|nr:class 1 fructose-bisphosphatase [Halodesulfovibrio sp.]MCT4534886.1 class 1 fructose-bisphosphatase [Halodesulfovibrio sp.]